MGTALLALCFCALSLILALFVGISPISDKAKIRFMYVGAALSLMAGPMMSHYIAGLNDIVDELRYQAVLVFIVVVCCYCFVMANMVKYNVMKKKVAVLEDTVEKLEQERAVAMSQAVDEDQQHKVQEALDWFAAKMSVFSKEEQEAINACAIAFAERDLVVIPKVSIAVNAKCSQADLMAYASSAFFKIGKKRKNIAQILPYFKHNYALPPRICHQYHQRNHITCTRPKHTLQKSFVKLFPQTVFSNKLYCLGEITFDRLIILFRHITEVVSELYGIFLIRQHQF